MPVCSQCGIENPEHNSFCLECGCAFSVETGKLNPDSVLEGRYVIVKVLGRGGMGAVYQAVDQRLKNSLVAVKEMSATALGKDNHLNAVSAFEKEAAMLIGLRHPALPRISDFFSKHDRWYLVMDYIEGETLADVLKKRGAIPEPEIKDWGIQLCEILDYLHSQTPPVIFRDLKPANIMITPDGRIKLIDFGIARHFRPGSTADTTAYGSSGYAPPEQYGDNQTDARSDIYALGAVLHHLLTGKDPVKNPFDFEPPGKNAAVSPALEVVIMKALELKPADRPATVREVLALLRDDGSSSPVNKELDAMAQTGGETAQFDTGPVSGATSHQDAPPIAPPRKRPFFFRRVAPVIGIASLIGAGAYGFYTWERATTAKIGTPQARQPNSQALPPASPSSPFPFVTNKERSSSNLAIFSQTKSAPASKTSRDAKSQQPAPESYHLFDDAQIVDARFSGVVNWNDTIHMALKVKNTGTTTWDRTYMLTVFKAGHEMQPFPLPPFSNADGIAPGKTGSVTFSIEVTSLGNLPGENINPAVFTFCMRHGLESQCFGQRAARKINFNNSPLVEQLPRDG